MLSFYSKFEFQLGKKTEVWYAAFDSWSATVFMIFQVCPGLLLLSMIAGFSVQHITELRGQAGGVLCWDTPLFCTLSHLLHFLRRSSFTTTLNSR